MKHHISSDSESETLDNADIDRATEHIEGAKQTIKRLRNDPMLSQLFEPPDWLTITEIEGEQ